MARADARRLAAVAEEQVAVRFPRAGIKVDVDALEFAGTDTQSDVEPAITIAANEPAACSAATP